MSRGAMGCGLIVAGFGLVALGVWLKRSYDLKSLMVVLHSLATVGFLIPGILTLVWRPNTEDD